MGAGPQAALGELLALDPTTLSRTLRPLARAGWIRAGLQPELWTSLVADLAAVAAAARRSQQA